jgi:hypothetical protein
MSTSTTSPCLWYLSVSETTGHCLSYDDINRVLDHAGCDDVMVADKRYVARVPLEWESHFRRLGHGACFCVELEGHRFRVAVVIP